MKRILILVVLVGIAGIAGIVRSRTHSGDFDRIVSHNASQELRDEIRQSYQLAPGAVVELSNINGEVKIETSDTQTAEVLVERTGSSQEALNRRKITVAADSNSLRILGEKGDVGLLARLFGSKPTEKVTLKLPRQISLQTKGINGAVIVGEIEGSVEVRGVNGRVQIAGASGTALFKGVNGNILVGLKKINDQGVTLNGINGNIELRLETGLNADLDANGMNGRIVSDMAEVTIDKSKHGKYSARIGSGGSAITAKGINGNIRLTRAGVPTEAAEAESTSKHQSGSEKAK
jgi:hypothetical protein